MITSIEDYHYYLQADRIALGIRKPTNTQEAFAFRFWNEPWKFQKLLRKTEYYQNCSKGKLSIAYFYYLRNALHKQQIKLGIFIPPNCFGPGLSIVHTGSITVNAHAKIGANCRINVGTVIATKEGFADKTPIIGNNVFIGSGAIIFGDIVIADGIAIGANSIVNKSFTEPNVSIAGNPARIISHKGSKGLLVDATKILNDNKQTKSFRNNSSTPLSQ
jgi:serine O-acetyltransferase